MKYGNVNLGQVEAVWNKLGGEEGVQRFLAGAVEVIVKDHLIDCDTAPYLPKGWKGVESHRKGGQLKWNPTKVSLHLSPNQMEGKVARGNDLREEFKSLPIMNANVLDYLLAHTELIPDEWKGKAIFFWGTIYCHVDGNLYVRFLYWSDGRWSWSHYWLDNDWYSSYPAAVLAS